MIKNNIIYKSLKRYSMIYYSTRHLLWLSIANEAKRTTTVENKNN